MTQTRAKLQRGLTGNQQNRNKGKALAMALRNKNGQEVQLSEFGDLPCCAGTIHLLALEQVHRKATVPSPQGALDQ